jgi:uncharacterized protein YdhG (YjbR/CyaY superfamily)
MPKKAKPKSITEYIAAAPKEAQGKLRQMRACIRSAAPEAKESLKWGMPAFSYHRILVTFAAFKHHIGFYPTPRAVKAFAKDLSNIKQAVVQFSFRSIRRCLCLSSVRLPRFAFERVLKKIGDGCSHFIG